MKEIKIKNKGIKEDEYKIYNDLYLLSNIIYKD